MEWSLYLPVVCYLLKPTHAVAAGRPSGSAKGCRHTRGSGAQGQRYPTRRARARPARRPRRAGQRVGCASLYCSSLSYVTWVIWQYTSAAVQGTRRQEVSATGAAAWRADGAGATRAPSDPGAAAARGPRPAPRAAGASAAAAHAARGWARGGVRARLHLLPGRCEAAGRGTAPQPCTAPLSPHRCSMPAGRSAGGARAFRQGWVRASRGPADGRVQLHTTLPQRALGLFAMLL